METEKSIEVKHLSKNYKELKALDDISFDVYPGELFAFLGVNGAGKSTTIKIICGQLSKDAGEVLINGLAAGSRKAKEKALLGVVFQDSRLDSVLSVKENLEARAALYGISGKAFQKRLKELVELFELEEFLDRRAGKLSGGQRRRVDIARALIASPSILILDEPTTGLDPAARKKIWEILGKLKEEEGLTLFLTTHYMEEAAQADFITVIDKGKIVEKGSPNQLKNKYVKDYLLLYDPDPKFLSLLEKDFNLTPFGEAYRVELDSVTQATELIGAYPQYFSDYELIKGKMDDVFLAITESRKASESI